jgi:cystathionine beta-lyase
VLGYIAALAAYRDGADWLAELQRYLTANRDFLVNYVLEYLPGLSTTVPEATYLAWFDCRAAGIDSDPFQFFLNQALVALNDGIHFGQGGDGFVRLNFGCPRSILVQALERMRAALPG